MKIKQAAVVLAASAIVALAGPAMAAGPYSIEVGTYVHGDYGLSGQSGLPSFSVHHGSGSTHWGCSSSTMSGQVRAGVNPSGRYLGGVFHLWSGCVWFGGLALNITQPLVLWSLDLTGPATNSMTDDVTGVIGGIEAHAQAALGAWICNFDIIGEADVILHETVNAGGAQRLEIAEHSGGNLYVDNVTGCFGAISDGDPMSLAATYDITSPAGSINVKQ